MIYLLLAGIGALAVVVYLVFVLTEVPAIRAERLGEPEPLPEGIGTWRVDRVSPEGRAAAERGEQREERDFLEERSGALLHQVRYRRLVDGSIVRVEPETRRRRRRVRR